MIPVISRHRGALRIPSTRSPGFFPIPKYDFSSSRVFLNEKNGSKPSTENPNPVSIENYQPIFNGELQQQHFYCKNIGESSVNAGQWATSFHGLAVEPFPENIQQQLMLPIDEQDIEVKPDGLLYLPEIKYRRILNRAFGPGAWGLVPRGPHSVAGQRTLTREYALIAMGRFVSQARGEQDFFSPDALPTATEGVKSNALMRCCKDLGIASELWDPVFIRKWKALNAVDVWAVDVKSKQRRKVWRRKDEKLSYPYQESQ